MADGPTRLRQERWGMGTWRSGEDPQAEQRSTLDRGERLALRHYGDGDDAAYLQARGEDRSFFNLGDGCRRVHPKRLRHQ